jgi:hypothetical protein
MPEYFAGSEVEMPFPEGFVEESLGNVLEFCRDPNNGMLFPEDPRIFPYNDQEFSISDLEGATEAFDLIWVGTFLDRILSSHNGLLRENIEKIEKYLNSNGFIGAVGCLLGTRDYGDAMFSLGYFYKVVSLVQNDRKVGDLKRNKGNCRCMIFYKK